MSEDRLSEVVLSRRVQPQPTPDLVAGGDCGACVLGGALGIPIERIYEIRGKRETISHHEMSRMLRVAQTHGLADRIMDEHVEFPGHWGGMAAFGNPAYLVQHHWHKYVQMAIDAGYYGLAEIDHARNGGEGKGGTDHWVLICGARCGIKWSSEKREGFDAPISSGKYINDVLVSCSARSSGMKDEWVDAGEFLKKRGGYNLLFVRPAA